MSKYVKKPNWKEKFKRLKEKQKNEEQLLQKANVYKIGMTRRLEPLERIRELSSASVPFAFDVHALIWSEDAPALENMLHKKFALAHINKVNFRKRVKQILRRWNRIHREPE